MINKNLSNLNGWQRIFVVLTLFIQTPITIFFAINQNIEQIGTNEVNKLSNKLYEEKKIQVKARIYSLNEVDAIKFSNLKLADIDWSKDPSEVNKFQGFKVFEARKVGYSDSEILDYLVKEWKLDISNAKRNGLNDEEILNNLIAQSQGGRRLEIKNEKFNYVYDVLIEDDVTTEQTNSFIILLKERIDYLYYKNYFLKILNVISVSIIFSLILYAIGFSVAWVIKGFNQSKGS